jgi:aspartyl/asparaginyl beta-hydroxylase (cupin superfamily)
MTTPTRDEAARGLSGEELKTLLEAADRAMMERDPARAASILEQYVAASGTEAEGHLRLAVARRASGDMVGALGAAQQALTLQPGNLLAALMLASLLQRMARREEAARAYRAALSLAPDEARLPPPVRAELARARSIVAADDAWRRAVAGALDALPEKVAPAERDRLERFRDNLLDGAGPSRGNGAADFPGLPEPPFFDPGEIPGVADLEAATDRIRDEFLRAAERQAAENISLAHYGGADPAAASQISQSRKWSGIHLYLNGRLVEENAALCPETVRLYDALDPPRIPGRSPNLMFSLLDPHTRIPPHHGVTKTRLVLHVPLIVPDGCGLRVGAETRRWVPGQALVFDDTFEHEAFNDSDDLRVVLLGDIWRPELSAAERRAVALMMARDPEVEG